MQISQLDNELENFVKNLIETWNIEKHQKIGLSIQTLNDTQKRVSESDTALAVNDICSSVLNNGGRKIKLENRLSCNRLDSELKKIVNDKGNIYGLACKCHKGISNIIVPFIYTPKGKDKPSTQWYILYGQFLLTPIIAKTEYSLIEIDISKNLLLSKNIEILSNSPSRKYVQLGPFTSNNKISDITKFSNSPISEVDVADFLSFKSYVEINFTHFLDSFNPDELKNREDEQSPLVKTIEKLQLASTNLSKIEKTKNKANENVTIVKGILESVNAISNILSSNKSNPKLLKEGNLICELEEFADLEDSQRIETKAQQNKGEALLLQLKSYV